MQPLVSIIIPTYNRAHLIGETLDSVIAQTYTNWECIVVDDDSADYTDELIAFYCEKDSRIHYYHRPVKRPKGANTCRNYGFEKSMGIYIQWLDSDDILGFEKIERQLKLLQSEAESAIATCRWTFFSHSRDILKTGKNLPVFKSFDDIEDFLGNLAVSGGFLPPHTYLMSRNLVLEAGNWLENLLINQDGEFFSRIFIRIAKVVYCEDVMVHYRSSHGDNVSDLNIEKINHAIYSWNLIENNLFIRFGSDFKLVQISRKYLYQRLREEYPNLIKEHSYFFRNQLKKEKIIKKVGRLVKTLIRKK